MAIEPVTREERFLAAAGGQSVTPPTPITRKEQLLQGIIDAVKSSGATPDVIENAVNKYLDANPVQPGATTEQAAQIEQNKTDIADLQTEVDELKESGGNGSGQNPPQDGEDGATFTPTVSADGTLSWTNDKGLENPAPVNIKGPQGNQGPKGDTGATGAAGKNGTDGYSPVRGTDYWTEADKVEIVQRVIESLGGNPIFGIVDENNNIIVSGDLPDGTYSVKYEMENGTKLNIGNLVIDTNVYYTVTNTLTNCTISNSATQAVQGGSYSATITANSGYELKSVTVTMGGSPVTVSGGKITISNVTGNIVITAIAEAVQTATNFADPTSSDWWADSYLSSAAEARNKTGFAVSNFIGPLNAGDVIRVTGIDMTGTIAEYRSAPYKSDNKVHGSYGVTILAAKTTTAASNITVSETGGEFTNVASDVIYWRIGGLLNSNANNVVINIKRNGAWL